MKHVQFFIDLYLLYSHSLVFYKVSLTVYDSSPVVHKFIFPFSNHGQVAQKPISTNPEL